MGASPNMGPLEVVGFPLVSLQRRFHVSPISTLAA